MKKIIFIVVITFGILIVWVAGEGIFLFFNNKETPEYAKEYSVLPLSCSYQENICTKIDFYFFTPETVLRTIPSYLVEEFPNEARTKVTFYNIGKIKAQFTYNEVVSNPLIEELNYYKKEGNFIVEIKRKGAFLPAEIVQDGFMASIILKEGDQNYPIISDQKPAADSAAYPAFRKISFKAALKDSLKKAVVFFQNKPVDFSTELISPNEYLFNFDANILKDEQYFVKAIIADSQNRTTVLSWMFEGQIPVAITLGKDRFKYLGWWGRINANGVSIRKEPKQSSEELDPFSSLNNVKVLKEVYGETVNDNNVWYEIDGGKHPHAYVFSEYVTPIEQPQPPQKFTIPEGVKEGEYWIDVDLTQKFITLFSYDKPVFSSYVSTGKLENPTITGTFRIWYKLKKTRMRGGPPLHGYIYDLADVPSVLFYNEDYAIHGTYWHDKFGSVQSAGCTNLTQGDAAFIFEKVNPKLDSEKNSIFSSPDNPGTVVYNHY